MRTYNNFEFLLFSASEECCKKQAEEFLGVNDEGFEITNRQRKRMKHLLRKYTKKEKNKSTMLKWKWIAVACLLSLSIALTACVSIPELREAIKKFFLDWKEDFVAVGFGDKAEQPEYPDYEKIMPGDQPSTDEIPSDNSTGDSTQETTIDPPTEILKKAYATYLPGEYVVEITDDTPYYYSVNYCIDGNLVFVLTQNVIRGEFAWLDSENQIMYQTKINGYDAIILEEKDITGCYNLIWRDREYEYVIMGMFSNIQELTKTAEGIKT